MSYEVTDRGLRARLYTPNHGLKLGERVSTRGASSGVCV